MITISISDRLVRALCDTLMHSLWQGVLLATFAGLTVICTRKASSALRYNLLVSALILFSVGALATFVLQYLKTGNALAAQPVDQPSYSVRMATAGPFTQPATTTAPKPAFADRVTAWLNDHHNTIVLVWFLIICARSLQLGVGLYGTYRLKRVRVSAVKDRWPERMRQLAAALGIRQTIALLESGLAKAPMMIGHLKPVILIPVGLLAALSPAEVEAILIHELAHIKRRDYLVNLLQNLTEIIFFFNPAVLWISTLIRTERENCCDDLALARDNNKATYIHALVSCEEYQSSVAPYAMAFPGGRNTLLHRVRRLVSNRNHSLNLFEKTVLTICLAALGLGVSAFKARENIKNAVKPVAAINHHDAEAKHKQSAPVDESIALFNRFKRTALSATNTHKQPGTANSPLALPARPDTTKPAFDTTHAIGRELYRENLLTDTNHLSINLTERELIVNGVRMPDDVYQRIYTKFCKKGGNEYYATRDRGLQEKSEQIAYELLKEDLVQDKTYFTYKLSRNEFSIDGIKQPDELRRRIVDEYFKPDDYFNLNYIFRDPGIYGGSNSRYSKSSTDYQPQREEQLRYWAGQQTKIIDEMARESLINDRNNVSFTLTDKTFVINGLVQSDEVFQRYHQEYVPVHAGDNWNWNYNNNPGSSPTNAYGSRDWVAYNRQMEAERQRSEAERDKKLVADLLQDGLITDPNNVTFTLTYQSVSINGKRQSDEVFQKYKEKYLPANAGSGWSWTYSHH